MTRRLNLAAVTALSALLLTGVIAAQIDPTPSPMPMPRPESTLAPEATDFVLIPEATPALDEGNSTAVDAVAIRFRLPPSVASGAQVMEEAAVPIDLTVPPFGQAPALTRITLEDYAPGSDVLDGTGQLYVLNTDDFEAYDFGDAGIGYPSELESLQRLLAERPELATEELLPHLPLYSGIQAFHAREIYVEFNGGSGILYLAYYSFSVDPILEGTILALFQGLSDDGLTYISAELPIDTGDILPDELWPDFNQATFEAGYEEYQASIRRNLNEMPDVSTQPPLDDVVAMLASITVVR